MLSPTDARFANALQRHPKRFDGYETYGPNGLITGFEKLDSICFRLGIIAACRSKAVQGKAIGAMISGNYASSDENGIKLIDYHGGIFEDTWIRLCSRIVNLMDGEVRDSLEYLYHEHNVPFYNSTVFIAMDARGSSPALARAVTEGAKILDAEVRHLNMITSPILHYALTAFNKATGDPTETAYYEKISTSFIDICNTFDVTLNYIAEINVDCANSVVAPVLEKLVKPVEPFLIVHRRNTATGGMVNFECGADYVQSRQRAPESCTAVSNVHWASLNAVGDRLVYYYRPEFRLTQLTGDKMAVLFCLFIKELLEKSGLKHALSLQVIHTAFMNTAAVDFLQKQLKVNTVLSPMGPHHLIRRTGDCDISIWFESHGHGSVFYSQAAYGAAQGVIVRDQDHASDRAEAALTMIKLFNLMNQSTGDAIANLLLVEAILRHKDWNPLEWDNVYNDVPNKFYDCGVKNPFFLRTNEFGNVIIEPATLQTEVTQLCTAISPISRAVLAISEDKKKIRIYCEAPSREEADRLSIELGAAVVRHAAPYERPNSRGDAGPRDPDRPSSQASTSIPTFSRASTRSDGSSSRTSSRQTPDRPASSSSSHRKKF